MYDFHIKDQVQALVKAEIISEDQVDKATGVLNRYWEDTIAITWNVDDVQAVARNRGKRLSKEKARDILQTILHKHDANIGVNWEVIGEYLP